MMCARPRKCGRGLVGIKEPQVAAVRLAADEDGDRRSAPDVPEPVSVTPPDDSHLPCAGVVAKDHDGRLVDTAGSTSAMHDDRVLMAQKAVQPQIGAA